MAELKNFYKIAVLFAFAYFTDRPMQTSTFTISVALYYGLFERVYTETIILILLPLIFGVIERSLNENNVERLSTIVNFDTIFIGSILITVFSSKDSFFLYLFSQKLHGLKSVFFSHKFMRDSMPKTKTVSKQFFSRKGSSLPEKNPNQVKFVKRVNLTEILLFS